jgi:hypothetical protein
MFSEVITYKDIDGNEAQEEYWFSLDESEIAQLKVTHKRDIGQYFRRIINADSTEQLILFYRELLELGVCMRVGQRLDKSQEVRDMFVGTGAYNALFLKLIQSPDQGASWINKMFPQELIEKYADAKAENYSDDELIAMTNMEFNRVAGPKKSRDKRMTIIALKRRELNREKNESLLKA